MNWRTNRRAGLSILALSMLLAMALPSGAMGQETGAEKQVKVFRVGKSNQQSFNSILNSQFKTFPVGEDSLGIIDTPQAMETASKMIETLKAASPGAGAGMQETIYVSVIGASLEGQSGNLPKMLGPALREMESVFPYKAYTPLDMVPILVDTKSGDYTASSTLPVCDERLTVACVQNIRLRDVRFEADSISVGKFSYSLNHPSGERAFKSSAGAVAESAPQVSFPFNQSGIESGFALKPGQSLVLGKLGSVAGEDAIFVVVSRLAK